MSDSLRDQLLQAGFNAPKEKAKNNKKSRSGKPNSAGRPNHSGKPGSSGSSSGKQGSARPDARPEARQNSRQGGKPSTRQGQHTGAASHNTQASAQKNARQQERIDAQKAADAEVAKRKAVKAEIKTLIEAAAIKEHQGESVYRFILNKRIRELHVKDEIREQLVAGTLIITRLNGSTWLVPQETAAAIHALNPDWAVVTPAPDTPDDTTGYEDFPVPDDLQW